MVPLLFVAFIAVPLAELYVIIQVGQWLGVLPTIALLLLASVTGSVLVRSQGRAAWRSLNRAIQAGRPPAREVLDGALILFGGALLLTPGFLTDFVGIALLLPPTRAMLRALLVRRLLHGMTASLARTGPAPRGAASRPRSSYDVDGSAVDVDPRADGPRR